MQLVIAARGIWGVNSLRDVIMSYRKPETLIAESNVWGHQDYASNQLCRNYSK